MHQTVTEGWREFELGHYEAAEQLFSAALNQNGESTDALQGLAYVAFERGDYNQARVYIRRGMAIKTIPAFQILAAQIVGVQGDRRQAEVMLRNLVKSQPDLDLARAVYAEQIVRQGRWEEGISEFVTAMNRDQDGKAFSYFQQVVAGLVEAVITGKLPESAATQFINRMAYTLPNKTRQMNLFFGRARRAINAGKPLTLTQAPDNNAPASDRLSRPDRSPNVAPPGQHRGESSVPPKPAQRSSIRSQPVSSPTQTSAQATSQPQQISSNLKDMQSLIQRERDLNRELLSDLPETQPPKWPSEAGYSKIDTIPAIILHRDSLLGDAADIDTRDFRVTTGSLATEIFLERCLRNLLVATQEKKVITLVARPSSVWQMELNCRDGLLKKVAPPSDLYSELDGYKDFAQLALGMFLGDSIATIHDGTWTFEHPATRSYLELGDAVLKPFELVARWADARDKDDVNLSELSRLAQKATATSTSMTIVQEYIDPTRGLTDVALGSSLASLWSIYRFCLPDTAFTEIADTIEVQRVQDTAIVFTLPSQWAPEYAGGQGGAARLAGDRVALAYLRDSGEFVALGSRKGFAHYLEATVGDLNADMAREIVVGLSRFHCPNWKIAVDKSSAAELSKRANATLKTPKIQAGGAQSSLLIYGLAAQTPVRLRLSHNRENLIKWQLDIQSSQNKN